MEGTLEGALGQQGEVEGEAGGGAGPRPGSKDSSTSGLSPRGHLEHTGFFKTLDTDLDGVVTFDLFKVGFSSGRVGEGTQGQWVFLTRPPPRRGWSLQPQSQP